MTLRTQLAYLAAGITLVLGLLSLLNPLLAVRLVGLEVIEPRGISEIRATYGALFVVMGGVMFWAVPTRPRNRVWLRFAGFLWLGAAAGRILSVVIDGVLTPFNLVSLALELAVGVGAVLGSFERIAPPRAPVPESDEPEPLRAYRS